MGSSGFFSPLPAFFFSPFLHPSRPAAASDISSGVGVLLGHGGARGLRAALCSCRADARLSVPPVTPVHPGLLFPLVSINRGGVSPLLTPPPPPSSSRSPLRVSPSPPLPPSSPPSAETIGLCCLAAGRGAALCCGIRGQGVGGRTDRRTDRRTDGWMDGQTDSGVSLVPGFVQAQPLGAGSRRAPSHARRSAKVVSLPGWNLGLFRADWVLDASRHRKTQGAVRVLASCSFQAT